MKTIQRLLSGRWHLVMFLSMTLIWANALAETGDERKFSRVRILLNSADEIRTLHAGGVFVEHFAGSNGRGIDAVLDDRDVRRLEDLGILVEVLVDDIAREIRSRPSSSEQDMEKSRRFIRQDRVGGFELGAMGGFYTFDQVVTELDSMFLAYPNLITGKSSIGTSIEGRDIWMVKISDNPTEDESATEPAIHYDALHHAREPASMMSTVYYMYWLLNNYGVDPVATYIVDHRELFFVPVVNPDGYVHNENTNPDGGGMWRKNRRDIGGCGDDDFGVDLNRNYSFGYGDPKGSSDDPCASNYRGKDAFSEPESQAIRDLIAVTNPAIGFSVHTYGDKFLNPYGYTEEAPEYEIYSEFSSDFVSHSSYLYGITWEMLRYFSSGTTRDYLHSEGTYGWTPELGSGSDWFWPDEERIVPIASENLPRFRYIAWVGGAFADFKSYSVTGEGHVLPEDTLSVVVELKNRGLRLTADDVSVSVETSYPYIIPLLDNVHYGNIPARQTSGNESTRFQFVLTDSAGFLDDISLVVVTTQEGVETSRDTVLVTVGRRTVLFYDDAEQGRANWSSSGSGIDWDTTFVDSYDGSYSFADSRYGNSDNSTTNYFTLDTPVDLSGTENPRLCFAAKWSIEGPDEDYARVQISTNGGGTWTSLAGRYTAIINGQHSYSGSRHWVEEVIDLTAYTGEEARFRFFYDTDSFVPGDGFYFDRFRIVDLDDAGTTYAGEDQPDVSGPYLHQNHPNPFNPETTIRYGLPGPTQVAITIYNNLGQRIKRLVEGFNEAGNWAVTWDGTNDAGNQVSSGLYLYRIHAGAFVRTEKMLLLR